MRPGDLYWAEIPDAGPHMILVVSREELNRGNRVQAVPLTSKRFEVRSKLATCVPFLRGENGFRENCVAQCDAMIPIPIQAILDRDGGPIGRISDELFREIIVAIGYCMDSSCEPN